MAKIGAILRKNFKKLNAFYAKIDPITIESKGKIWTNVKYI
jgi:hypothetical protein